VEGGDVLAAPRRPRSGRGRGFVQGRPVGRQDGDGQAGGGGPEGEEEVEEGWLLMGRRGEQVFCWF
jgi:hypothetical protein